MNLQGKKVFVYGLGRTGVSVVLSLTRSGAQVYVWDDKTTSWPDELQGINNTEICGPEILNWEEIDLMVKSPGISYESYAVKRAEKENVPIIGDIDLFFEKERNATFIGITGTNGKSTTTALIAHVIREAGIPVEVGGNFGIPALSLPSLGSKGVYVLELSSYQLEMIEKAYFDVSIFLNLTPDHLEHHGSMQNYLEAKKHIFDRQDAKAIRIMGVDNKETKALAKELSSDKQKLYSVMFGEEGANVIITPEGLLAIADEEGFYETILNFHDFPNLPGEHNWQNIACAYLATKEFMDRDTFIRGLEKFTGLPHRLEIVHKENNILFVNDSKATNAPAANCALSSYSNIYWLAGGLAKEEGVKPCISSLKNVRAVFLFGDAMDRFYDELQAHIPVFKCETMDEAVKQAYVSAKQEMCQDPVVLLSPACASFDQFSSYEHRGDVFASLCRDISEDA
jgi:UDP-N-acetylmuramoylalanine--D-glutamate ligase